MPSPVPAPATSCRTPGASALTACWNLAASSARVPSFWVVTPIAASAWNAPWNCCATVAERLRRICRAAASPVNAPVLTLPSVPTTAADWPSMAFTTSL